MSSEQDKLEIVGLFDDEALAEAQARPAVNRYKNNKGLQLKQTSELVQHPETGEIFKLAYGKMYDHFVHDLDIELDQIGRLEPKLHSTTSQTRDEAKQKLIFHYRQAVCLCSTKFAAGWSRWSDDILEMFLSGKTHKVLWGSGNCGKSAIMGLLLYLKWRVNPPGRMMVIASRVVKDAAARVFGYIKNVHADAPPSSFHDIRLVDSAKEKGIYHLRTDPDTGRQVKNDQGCILSQPVKVNARTEDFGSNLVGKHPDDQLCICFDEAQELPALMAKQQIFQNFYTNDTLEVFAWGNPQPIDFHDPESHDLLFYLGTKEFGKQRIKTLQQQAEETFVSTSKSTYLLHLTMLDSPKDDLEELQNFTVLPTGQRRQRLHFLGGRSNANRIAESIAPNSAAWYSQVLGFPYLNMSGEGSRGVLSAPMVKTSREYPLRWHTPEDRLSWFMGVDPSLTGHRDPCAIMVGRMGEMMDGRIGVELMKDYCRHVKPIEDREFPEVIVESMYNISQMVNIPLRNIGIEVHGAGNTVRYVLDQYIMKGFWAADKQRGETYNIIDPTQPVTERHLFKTLGNPQPANKMVSGPVEELWFAIRCAVLTRQIFNIPELALQQFYNRYRTDKNSAGKWKIENKADMKKRGVSSPNDADALAIMFEVCRRNGFAYKYYDKPGYVMKYGPHAEFVENQELIYKRMGIVSQMLNVHNQYNLPRSRQKPRRKYGKYYTPDV
jgi:hypothetical protein